MQAPWTDSATRALERAKEKTKQYKREWVGSEHLLLSILSDEECTAFRALHHLGIIDAIKAHLEVLLACGIGDIESPTEMVFSHSALSDRAHAETRGALRQVPRVDTDDLLVAFMQNDIGKRLFYGVSVESVEQALAELGVPYDRAMHPTPKTSTTFLNLPGHIRILPH